MRLVSSNSPRFPSRSPAPTDTYLPWTTSGFHSGQIAIIQQARIPDVLRLSFAPATIASCLFSSLASGHVFGGAILSFAHLSIANCHFENCKSNKAGGSIAAFSRLSVNLTFFTESESEFASAVFCESGFRESLDIHQCLFSKCLARTHDGTVVVRRTARVIFETLNVTDCVTSSDFGVLTASAHECTFDFVCCFNCGNAAYNSGITVFRSTFFVVNFCAFQNLSRSTPHNFSAVAFHGGNCTYGKLNNCAFLRNENQGRPSIYLWTGNPIYVIGCCFVQSREDETQELEGFLAFEGCSFEANCRTDGVETEVEAIRHGWHEDEAKRLFFVVIGIALLAALCCDLTGFPAFRRLS
jgi:hypothetical protein